VHSNPPAIAPQSASALSIRPLAISASVCDALKNGEAIVVAGHRLGASIALPGSDAAVFMSGPGIGLLPAHIVVRARDLDRVLKAVDASRFGAARSGHDLSLHIDSADVRIFRPRLAPNPAPMRSNCARANVGAAAQWLRAHPAPLGLGATAAQLLAPDGHWLKCIAGLQGDMRTAARALHALVGRGTGTTPAGDDLVVGALAYAWATLGQDAPVVAAMGLLDAELPALTTAVGTSYLRAAARGEFGSHLIAWVRALPRVTPQRALALAGRVARHGATSGYDTLLGFVAAVEAAQAA
jgi:hypothetical protein